MATVCFFPRWLAAAALLLATSALALAKPRVLMVVDNTFRPAANETANLLKSQADVVVAQVPPGETFPFTSQNVVANLDRWLGKDPWDLIFFNTGFMDLTYRAPGIQSFRVMSPEAGGEVATPPLEYRKNLETLAKRLLDTKAQVIWASTLPIKHSNLRIQVPGSEEEYNKIAAEVMTRLKVQVCDMHAKSQTLTPIKPPTGRKAGPLDKNPIHLPIIADICQALHLTDPNLQP